MILIEVQCLGCRSVVTLQPPEVTMTDARYGFRCPHCEVWIWRPLDAPIREVLQRAGVHERVEAHLEVHAGGPPITYDDLLDFALASRRTDYLAAAA